jgi:hypothetical protein
MLTGISGDHGRETGDAYRPPSGTEKFVQELEEATKRALAPRNGGRPAKIAKDERQRELF